MKKNITIVILLFSLALFAPCLRADDLSDLNGKWVAEQTNSEGRVKLVLEITKAKFTYQVLRGGDQVVIYARGDVKLEKLGPFKAARFHNIQGGPSSAELEPVDDDRTVIYTLIDNELTVASNFDRERSEPPIAVKYTKVPGEKSK